MAAPSVVGAAISITQFKPLCCLKKSNNPTFLFLGLGSVASPRTLRSSSNFHCRCVITSTSDDDTCSSGSSLDWDWERWSRHFSEVEEAEVSASSIKFQLEDAIEREDFQEAAKLKLIISEFSSKDSVAKIMSELKIAVDEERYHDASRLCKDTGSGLVGWWVGYSNDSGEPFGRLVRITPSVGRFVGRSYSPKQLVTASPGTPMFEIFVVKEADETYVKQVVYFGRGKGDLTNSIRLLPKPINSLSASESQSTSVKDLQGSEAETEKSEDKGMNIEGATDEGIKSLINYLKDTIRGLKMKVTDVEVVEDDDFVERLIDEEGEEESSGNSEDEDGDLEELRPDEIALIGGSSAKDEDTPAKKIIIGGDVHYEDTPTKDAHARLSADIKDMERDSFVLHVPRTNLVDEIRERKASKVKVASIAARDISQLMQSDIAKAFWSADKISSKVSKNAREVVKLAVSQARKRNNRLTELTTFNRIVTSEGNFDPFEGLYVGSFGPYGTEVVQLRRKFGHWNTDDESSDIEFFEYVEAVKLTGDLNVPAGEVTFRAKIGKGSRLTKRGLYPDELGVAATYRGQGRIAELGFKNPRWVVGELLQFSGKGMGQYVKGASLGFLYAVPEQSFLVLFNRLRLPE